MSPIQTGAPGHVDEAPSPTRSLKWRAIAAPILRNKSALVAAGVLAFFVFLAIFGPQIVGDDPKAKVGAVFEPPSREFPLGTDGGGANMLDLLTRRDEIQKRATEELGRRFQCYDINCIAVLIGRPEPKQGSGENPIERLFEQRDEHGHVVLLQQGDLVLPPLRAGAEPEGGLRLLVDP